MLVGTPEVDTTKAQKDWDQFVQKAGAGFDQVAGKGNAVVKSLNSIEKAAKDAAKAAEKIALKEMVDKAIQGIGALKGVWDGLATSVLGVNEAMAKSVSQTLDMTTKGAQLGAVLGPLGAIAGGAAGGFLDLYSNIKKFNEEAPQAADKLQELLTGAKENVPWWKDFGVVGQGARIALQKFSEAGEASKGTWYDFSVQGAGAKVVIDNIGSAALLNKDKVKEFNDAVKESIQYEYGGALFQGPLKGGPKKTPPKTTGGAPAKPTTTKETFTGITREEFLENDRKARAEADALFLEGLRRRDAWQQQAAESDYAFEAQKQATLLRIQEEANAQKQAIEEAHQAKMREIAIGAAMAIAGAVKDAAVAGVNAMLDAYANGERRSKEERKRARAERRRELGTQLMDDGFTHVIQGIAGLFSPNPIRKAEAKAEILAGLGEAALGAGWGGTGAIAQKRLGGTEAPTESSTPSKGSAEGLGGGSSSQNLAPIVVNFGSTVPMTARQRQEAYNEVQSLNNQRRRP